MLRRHIILLIAIRPSDGDVKPRGPLGFFEKSRLWAGTGFHILPSFHHHHPTQHNYTTQTVTHTVSITSTSYSTLYRYSSHTYCGLPKRHGRFARWRKWKSCDVGQAKERLENELWRRWSNGRVGEWAVTLVKRGKGWRMSCDIGEATENLENELCYDYNYELCSFSKLSLTSPTSQLILILQAFRHFTYVTVHSPTPSLALPTSELILHPYRYFTYVTAHSPTLLSLLLRHMLFTYVSWRAALVSPSRLATHVLMPVGGVQTKK